MELKNKINTDNEVEVLELLKTDSIKRNRHLNNVMRILCDISSPITLGIDGMWGIGKTVFARQLEILSKKDISDEFVDIDVENRTQFQDSYDVYYFNSWEYDMYDYPIQIFLYDLIKHRKKTMIRQDENIEKFNDIIEKALKPFTKLVVKSASMGIFEASDFEVGKTDLEQILEPITFIEDLKKHILEILKILTEDKNIVIIIDELDRCKPTFAVELLEVIKHYFSYEKISYIICSNKKELSHTVKRYYGEGFDGYGYLDRFIDFEYNLPVPNREHYLKGNLRFNPRYNSVVEVNCNYFNLSLRQINKYSLFSELVIKRDRARNSYGNFRENIVIQVLFPLYAFGLKMTNPNDFNNFIEGNGKERLIEYMNYSKEVTEHLARTISRNKNNSGGVELAIKQYEDLFIKAGDFEKEELFDIISFFE